MKKPPHIPLDTGDWLKDVELGMCTPGTRGIWMDLLCAMHERNRCGELNGTSDQIARLGRCSVLELEAALAELKGTNAASIEISGQTWVIANRRMKREHEIRLKRAGAGSIGGSKTASKIEARPETDSDAECQQVIEGYCVELGLPRSDGAAIFNKWIGNGWVNGGEPIRDWRATIRSWKLHGYLPSQKPQRNGFKQPESKSGLLPQRKIWDTIKQMEEEARA